MKHSIYSIALALFFVFGCNESPNESPSRVNDPNNPNSAKSGGTSDACFDIPTPTMNSAEQGDEIGEDTYGVTVCWGFATPADAYYTSTQYTCQGRTTWRGQFGYVPNSTLNPNSPNDPYEFWGGSQRSIVSSPAYSGHYEVYRSTDGGTTWTKLTDTRDHCYTDDNGGAGFAIGTELVYSVKEKSLEGSSPNQCTHHSLMAEGIGITIEDPCVEVPVENEYSVAGVYGDNVVWTGSDFSVSNSGQINPHWGLFIMTENSCTHERTVTDQQYIGPLCVRLVPADDDPTNAPEQPAHYQENKYHVDGLLDNPGPGSYILYYLVDTDDDGTCTYPDDLVATSNVTIN